MRAKPSLFKQKIKQARKEQPKEEESFPVPIKIEIKPPSQKTNFLQSLLSSTLDQREQEKINQENQKQLHSMKPSQIQQYKKLLRNSLPDKLLEKLSGKKGGQMIDEKEEQIKQDKIHIEERMEQQSKEQIKGLGVLAGLGVDVKNQNVIFLHPGILESEDVVSMESLQLMIGSQNNQTQIVACRLLSFVCKGLMSKYEAPCPLIIISGIPIHLLMAVEDITRQLLTPLMKMIRKTTFKSCWYELLTSLIQCTKILLPFLPSSSLPLIHDFLASQQHTLHKRQCQSNPFSEAFVQMLRDLSLTVEEEMKQPREARMNEVKNEGMKRAVEVMVMQEIEEGRNYTFPKLLDTMAITHAQSIHTCYLVCVELRKHGWSGDWVKMRVLGVWDKQIASCIMPTYLNSCENSALYHTMFCLQTLSAGHFAELLNKLSAEELRHEFWSTVTLLSLKEYQEKALTEAELENVQEMVIYVKETLPIYHPTLTFITLLSLFLQEEQSYAQLTAKSIDTLFTALCHNLDKQELWTCLDVGMVKRLINVYNYNSFGNYSFTRLLLYLIVTGSVQMQALLLEEVCQRYPFIFYFAAQQCVYGNIALYSGGQASNQKQEVLKMLSVKEDLNNSNIFVKYLTE